MRFIRTNSSPTLLKVALHIPPQHPFFSKFVPFFKNATGYNKWRSVPSIVSNFQSAHNIWREIPISIFHKITLICILRILSIHLHTLFENESVGAFSKTSIISSHFRYFFNFFVNKVVRNAKLAYLTIFPVFLNVHIFLRNAVSAFFTTFCRK